MSEDKKLKRVLNKFDLFAIGFGAIIGWGWISMGTYWIGGAGVLGACLSFVIAGALAIMIALCYGELASAMPKAGGPQNFAWRAFGVKAGIAAGWMAMFGSMVFLSWLCNAAVVALSYLFPAMNESKLLYMCNGYEVRLIPLLVYMGLSIMMIWLTYVGIQGMSKVQNISVIIMIGIAAVFIIVALFRGNPENFEPLLANGSKGVIANVLTCVLFLGGFECIPQSAEESTVKPRYIGRIIIVVMLAAVAWFLLTIIATSIALPIDEIKNSPLAAVNAMTAVFGGNPWAGRAMIIVGFLGVITSWISTYIVASRMMYSMARSGMFPRYFGELHPKFQTPYRAVIALGILMLACGFLGGGVNVWFSNVAGLTNVAAYCFTAASFIYLRVKAPDMKRPFRAGSLIIGIMGLLLSVVLLVISIPTLTWPYESALISVWIILGIIQFIRITRNPQKLKEVDDSMREVLADTPAEEQE